MISRLVFATQYIIPVDPLVFDIIIATDEISILGTSTLSKRIESLPGVSGADYNIFLGDVIYLSIEAEYDDEHTWSLIADLIEEYVGNGHLC